MVEIIASRIIHHKANVINWWSSFTLVLKRNIYEIYIYEIRINDILDDEYLLLLDY